MRVEFFDITKKHLWTGEIGVPIPRIGETVTFMAPLDGRPHRVIHVNTVLISGIGQSFTEVFVNEEGP